MAITRLPAALIAWIHSANRPPGARLSPVPKIASTTTSAPSKLSTPETSAPVCRSAASSRAAAPRTRSTSTQQTRASRPHRWRCLAAANPSPALLPTPHTTTARPSINRATCQPAASISQSIGMPNRSSTRASTCFACALESWGRSLDHKGAVRVVAVDRVCLRNGRVGEARYELRSDGADLRKLQRGVAERAVVDGYLHALPRLRLLDQPARAADPRHDAAELLVEVQPLQISLRCAHLP